MKKKLKKEIASRFNWNLDQTEEAIRGLNKSSQFDIEKILTICNSATSSSDRTNKLVSYFYSIYKGDFVTKLSKHYDYDTIFLAVALFNYTEIKSQLKKHKIGHYLLPFDDFGYKSGLSLDEYYNKDPKNFLYYFLIRPSEDNIKYTDLIEYIGHITSPTKIQYFIIDLLLNEHRNKKTEDGHILDMPDLFLNLFEQVGLEVFNTEEFLHLALSMWHSVDRDKIFTPVFRSLLNHILTGPQSTKRKYWLIYVLVSKLKENGLQTQKACEEVQIHLKEGISTIRRRYFQMKSEAEKLSLSIDEVIQVNQLHGTVKDFFGKSIDS